MENQRNQQGDMVDNQTVNKTNKYLKKREKRKTKKILGSGTVEFQS
jgi:uncharacterized C2H2 Zn-finger protein